MVVSLGLGRKRMRGAAFTPARNGSESKTSAATANNQALTRFFSLIIKNA